MPFVTLLPGDPGPTFRQRSFSNPLYALDSAAGRYLVLGFFGSAADPAGARALRWAAACPHFDDIRASFFGISTDPDDEAEQRVENRLPGIRFIWDVDLLASRLYGAAPTEATSARLPPRRLWAVLDPQLRVLTCIPFAPDGSDLIALARFLEALPPAHLSAGRPLQAPILYLPRVFELELCQQLIALYDAAGGQATGFMRQIDGKTVHMQDTRHKSRSDHEIVNPHLIEQLQARIRRRVVPEIAKVHQFHVTRMERYLIGCYRAEDGGHFNAHRDNTTAGTAHRRFAVSINLNADFDGGEVSFPEFSPDGFKAPPGGAVVFSCSLLHAVSQVTRGRRYAFLPFLYDEAAAALRERNRPLIVDPTAAGAAAPAPAAIDPLAPRQSI